MTMTAKNQPLLTAISGLSQADYLRLGESARIVMPGTSYVDPLALVDDAFVAACNATARQDGNGWNLSDPVVSYLITMIQRTAAGARVQVN